MPAFATLSQRISAYIVDCLVLFAGLLALQAALYSVNPIVAIRNTGAEFTGGQLHLWVSATTTVPFIVYFAAMIASGRGATLGMRLFRLRVTLVSGDRVPFVAAIIRGAVLLIPFELNHFLMFQMIPRTGEPPPVFWIGSGVVWTLMAIYLASVVVSPLRQSIHDRAAGTVVLRA